MLCSSYCVTSYSMPGVTMHVALLMSKDCCHYSVNRDHVTYKMHFTKLCRTMTHSSTKHIWSCLFRCEHRIQILTTCQSFCTTSSWMFPLSVLSLMAAHSIQYNCYYIQYSDYCNVTYKYMIIVMNDNDIQKLEMLPPQTPWAKIPRKHSISVCTK